MGGLSPLQRQILAVLPDEGNGEWARPKQILDTLGLEPTPSNRTITSRALSRLHKRGLISVIVTDLALPGKSRLYARRDRPILPTACDADEGSLICATVFRIWNTVLNSLIL